MLSNPNIVTLLLAIAFVSLLAEIASPAVEISGVIGVICLVLAAVGLSTLGVNWWGLITIFLAMLLDILSFKFGPDWLFILLAMALFCAGCLILFNSPGSKSPPVSTTLVLTTSTGISGLFYWIRRVTKNVKELPAVVGTETLVGKEGRVARDFRPNGTVIVGGEEWSAVPDLEDQQIEAGDRVIVTGIEGIRLKVRLAEGKES
jgi:membrane-bound serine protease (ClpP class)